jgi:hypothetical protein
LIFEDLVTSFMPSNHASAILRWYQHIQQQPDGLAGAASATVTTMLFGCHHWLEHHSGSAAPDTLDRIHRVKHELETWLAERGLEYRM